MNVRNLVIAYLLIGLLLWSGGVVPFQADDGLGAGVAGLFIDVGEDGNISAEEERVADLQRNETGDEDDRSGVVGVLQNVIDFVTGVLESLVGVLVAFIKLLSIFVNFLFYPISVLIAVDAPQEVVVLLGVAPTVAFYVAVVAGVRG